MFLSRVFPRGSRAVATVVVVAATASLLMMTSGAVVAAPMFVNGDFETGDFTGWTVSGNAAGGVATSGTPFTGTDIAGNTVQAHGGNFAAFAALGANAPATTLTLQQTVSGFEPGKKYQMTFWRGVYGTDPSFRWTPSVTIQEPDGTTFSTGGGFLVGSGYSALNSVFTANQSTATIRFDLGGKATDTGGPAGFSFDDFTIQQVPEPAALSLLALPALLFSRRRPRDRQLRRRRNG